MRAHVLERDGRRLLHYVAKVTGQRQLLALTLCQRSLDEQNLSSDRRPRQTCHHTGEFVGVINLGGHLLLAEEGPYQLRRNLRGHLPACHLHARQLTHRRRNLLVEQAHAALARVRVDDILDSLIRERNLIAAETVRLELLRYQVTPGNLYLLLRDITRNLHQLHAVTQRGRDGVERVCRRDEQHVREVIVAVEIVVVELRVLLRVEHLEKSRSRVPLMITANLVNLVEDNDRIGGLALQKRRNYAAGECPEIGAPVSANLRLIMQTAERHARILAPRRLGHAPSERGLADPRRTVQAEDRRLHVAAELDYRHLVKDTVLDLVQTEMVLIELLLDPLDGELRVGEVVPRKVDEVVEISILYRIVGRRRRETVKVGQLLIEMLLGLL